MLDIVIENNDIVISDNDIEVSEDPALIYSNIIQTLLKTDIKRDIIAIYELGSDIKENIIQAKTLTEIRDIIKSELEYNIKELETISIEIKNDIILINITIREDKNRYEIRIDKRKII
jgi:hypothetical protein